MSIFFFNKDQFYSRGNHPFSSASRDIVHSFYELVAPAMFIELTEEQAGIINQIYSDEELYRLTAQLICRERDGKTLDQEIYFKIMQLQRDFVQTERFIKPEGLSLTMAEVLAHPNCEVDHETAESFYNQIVFSFTTQDLLDYAKNKKEQQLRETDENIQESLLFLTENPNKNYYRWCIDKDRFLRNST